jgi:hypothetical protein
MRYAEHDNDNAALRGHLLAEAEVEAYHRDGIIVPEWRMPPDRLAELRDAVDAIIAANPGVRPEKLVSAHVTEGTEGVKGHQAFLSLAQQPQILDMVAQLMGSDIILWGGHLFCKPAGDGLEVPWHQDGHYWPIRPLATVTVWVALDDSTVENGCLRVIPGSHADKRHYEHEKMDGDLALDRGLTPGSYDPESARDVILQAGQMSMHDVYLLHGSNANQSPHRRAGIALRYMPASSLFDREMDVPNTTPGLKTDFAHRPLWQMRGGNPAGNDLSIGHNNRI